MLVSSNQKSLYSGNSDFLWPEYWISLISTYNCDGSCNNHVIYLAHRKPMVHWDTQIFTTGIELSLPSLPKRSWVMLSSQPVLQTHDFCVGAMKQQIVYLTKGRVKPFSDSPFWLHIVFLLDEKGKEMQSRKGFLRFSSWHSTIKLMLTKARFH